MSRARSILSWLKDRKGGLAPIAAMVILAVSMLAVGGIEMAELVSERSTMQDVADEAALTAAGQMDLSQSQDVLERAKAFAMDRMTKMGERTTVDVSAAYVDGGAGVQIIVHGHRQSFFGNLLPPGGWDVSAKSTAMSEGRIPLCVLAYGSAGGQTIELKAHSQISGPGCLIQSDDDVKVDGGALLVGYETRAVTSAVGPITPAPKTGASPIPDPFAATDLSFPSSCGPHILPEIYNSVFATIPAGMHHGDVFVLGNSNVTLAPGEHYFCGDLTIGDSATLTGNDVVLGFNKDSKFDFKDQSKVSLNGRKTGPLAGFVVFSARSNTHQFRIESDHVSNLLGTIYIPSAELNVTGQQKVAQSSAWTVIVAQSLKLDQSPILVLNTDYASSDVPVPVGVGVNRHNSRLLN